MRVRHFIPLLLAIAAALPLSAATLKVEGSSTLVMPFVEAKVPLSQQNVDLEITDTSNSPRAIAAVGEGQSDLGISTRRVSPDERANYPDRPLYETTIGFQALALIVSDDVWNAGIRSIKRDELQRIYERRITNWKQLGGPDRKIKFFNPQKGKGAWEFFVGWLYGEVAKTPNAESFETVATTEETRNLVEFNNGALSVIASNRAESKGTHALALFDDGGKPVKPTPAAIRSREYPLQRPIIVVTALRPAGAHKLAIDFMCSAQGQSLVKKADFIAIREEETE